MQLGYHDKPIAISNVNGYYNVLKDLLNKLVEQSFVKTSQVEKLIIGDNSADILNRIIESSRLSAKPA
jgi:predicted Rossmann-fold nucleotide-binding protein